MSYFKLLAVDSDFDGMEAHRNMSEFNSDNLDDVLGYLDMFLKGTGFVYDGELSIVKNERT